MISLALVAAWSAAAYAADDEHGPADGSMSSKMQATGAAAKHHAKAVGTAVREGAEKVKIEVKKVAHQVADAAKKGAHEVKVTAKEFAEKTKQAVGHGTGDHSDKQHEP
jgi:hypothetical protein